MRILHIEDDIATAEATALALRIDGIETVVADLGDDGLAHAREGGFEAILLDLNLPDMEGAEVLRRLRDEGIDAPVIVLSGDPSPTNKVRLLKLGADDFVCKPYASQELVARLKAVARRAARHGLSEIRCGKLVVDTASKTARTQSTILNLTSREYAMLEHFAVRKGAVLSKGALMAQLYGGMDEPDSKIIDVFVCKLRKKLSDATCGEAYIHTVWGAGYQMREPA